MSTYKEPLHRMCAFVFSALNTGANTSATCMHKHVPLHVCLLRAAHTLESQGIRVSLVPMEVVLVVRGSHLCCCKIKHFVVCDRVKDS